MALSKISKKNLRCCACHDDQEEVWEFHDIHICNKCMEELIKSYHVFNIPERFYFTKEEIVEEWSKVQEELKKRKVLEYEATQKRREITELEVECSRHQDYPVVERTINYAEIEERLRVYRAGMAEKCKIALEKIKETEKQIEEFKKETDKIIGRRG